MSDETPTEPPFDALRFAEAAMRKPINTYRLAEDGDKLAAREAIQLLLFELATTKVPNPVTGQPMPFGLAAREYLEGALTKISQGIDANRAFNLKKSGKVKWTYHDKWKIAQLVYQFVIQENSVEKAVAKAMSAIETVTSKLESFYTDGPEKDFKNNEPHHPFWIFKTRDISEEQVRAWYYELKGELEELDRMTRMALFS